MKAITRVIAVLMLVATVACVIAACGGSEKGYQDDRILGTWKQTDDVDGNWIWTFEKDGKCKLVGETTGFNGEGTYRIEDATSGKIHINISGWEKEKLFSYTCTDKVLDLEEAYSSYYCIKQ